MTIKILGSGCATCQKLYAHVQEAVANAGIDAEIIKVTDMKEIMAYDILSTPALVVDETVKSSGKLLKPEEIISYLV